VICLIQQRTHVAAAKGNKKGGKGGSTKISLTSKDLVEKHAEKGKGETHATKFVPDPMEETRKKKAAEGKKGKQGVFFTGAQGEAKKHCDR